jgi:methionine sulfoxide reductase catalytic subunit
MATPGEPDRQTGPTSPDTATAVLQSYRHELKGGHDVVDPATWAGSIPQIGGVAPRIRIGRSRWFNLLWLLPIGFVVLIVAVAIGKGLRNAPGVQHFIATNPARWPIRDCRSGLACNTSSTCSC